MGLAPEISIEQQLQAVLDEAIESGIPGLSVAVCNSQGLLWTGVAGQADITRHNSVQPEHLFGIGSITKTFVAVVILQLVEEGRLNLNTTAEALLGSELVGDVPNAGVATLAQLLNHTSGIPSWEDDPRWIKEGRGDQQDPDKIWAKAATLDYIKNQLPLANPGEKYAYANTNHTLLGLVIEAVTDHSLVDEIQQRILQPLGLSDIYLEGFQTLPEQRLAQRYHYATPEFRRDAGVHSHFTEIAAELIDVSASNLSVEWAAGGMVATAADLARYGSALQNGQLLKPESMAFIQQWFAINKNANIGHGVFCTNLADGNTLLGHMGAVLGYTAALHWFDDCDISMALLANIGTMHIGTAHTAQTHPSAASLAVNERWLKTVRQLNTELIKTQLAKDKPWLWLNPGYQTAVSATTQSSDLSLAHIIDAEARLARFAPLLVALFPQLAQSQGLIESELMPAPAMHRALGDNLPGKLWIKADHSLPVAGSIKARGGVYEVLCFAETLALENGFLKQGDNYAQLNCPEVRALFGQYTLSVGSTGNLGLSIGLMSAALGFQACVHMSVEAKQWKKQRLREQSVTVIEHQQDYSKAVAAGRKAAAQDPFAYFVDDENSETLFLGYSVAALRLQKQLQTQAIEVNTDNPLFVYLPCGVGGAPGGITFGLKQVFGEAVHCFFAEPTQAPCMLLGMATDFADSLTVYDVGLNIHTEADGLAVGQASSMVGKVMQPLLSGIFTISETQLFQYLYQLEQQEGLKIEPSAAAGFYGPEQLLNTDAGRAYLKRYNLAPAMDSATHIVWTTGGVFVPDREYQQYLARGRALSGG